MMQTNDTNIRGYFPQPDPNLPPRQQTAPFTPLQPTSPIVMRSEQSAPIAQRAAAVWQLLDKSMLMLLIAAVLGVAYALFVTISFWWFLRLLPHIVVTWAAVALTVAAMLTRDRRLTLVAVVGYLAAVLLFLNYCYLLIPSLLLSGFALYRMTMDQ